PLGGGQDAVPFELVEEIVGEPLALLELLGPLAECLRLGRLRLPGRPLLGRRRGVAHEPDERLPLLLVAAPAGSEGQAPLFRVNAQGALELVDGPNLAAGEVE